jgi:hypothetical protein
LCSFFLLQVDDVLITSLCCCVVFVFCASITLLHGSNVCISTGIFKQSLLLDPWNCISCFWWHHQAWSIVHIFKQWLVLVLCLQSILVVHFCAGNFVNLWDYIVCCKHRCRAMVLLSMTELICWFYFFCF